MSNGPTALIFGFGKNVGTEVAKSFSQNGYRVATVSRSESPASTSLGYIHIQGDLSDQTSIPSIFSDVRSKLGEPSVVVYNAAANSHMNKADPLSIPLADVVKDLNINTVSALIAAQEATKSFAVLPSSASKTFIFTGNILNLQILPPLMSNGIGKCATAHFLESAATAYKADGYKFYYADERKEDGAPVYNAINGEAHGKFYVELSEGREQGPWLATFVKGIGYKDFSAK
ncbi:hypothetical protein EG327_004840 [Venturia inaequalis]|uniref:Uncharacterized protein n=1 Tax=Venturia inaequalis TaxID=5025 RepID=A0A8H3VDP6_VENIN|nr:hypothetical protein EG327_004840 [Venturia inaequalis]